MATTQPNPLFTSSEKGRFRRTMKKRVRGAARKGLAKIFGIPLSKGLGGGSSTGKSSRRPAHRSQRPASGTGPSTSVRSDVIEALKGQGYSAGTAKKMAEGVKDGDTFESAFRRVISRNPAELIIFGNPAMVYGRKQVIKAKRAGNPIPAALITAFESAAGSKLFDEVTSKKRNHGGTEARRKAGKKKNPGAEGRAEQLFETFHHRGASGVFERQRSARQRKDYTILGPLVAIGWNAEKFDTIAAKAVRNIGRKGWDDYAVEHFDRLPHLAFMTPGQVAQVKRILGDPDKYVQDAPLLAQRGLFYRRLLRCEGAGDLALDFNPRQARRRKQQCPNWNWKTRPELDRRKLRRKRPRKRSQPKRGQACCRPCGSISPRWKVARRSCSR
jgi:hypothetical protein